MIRGTKSLLSKPAVRKARAKQLAEQHGRHIYAYQQVGTNQVLYSLSRQMKNNDMLKQFPDIGANHTPRALRKDVWRPFFTVSMPEGSVGMAQGLLAYKHLREWRKLHETTWEVSPLLARPHGKEEIEALQKSLDDRGGSKTENVWDLIKRAKKKMRVHTVRNQKANSVADLATVLQDLDDLGKRTVREQMEERQEDRRKEIEKMLALAEQHDDGGLQKLQEEISDVERQLEAPAEQIKNITTGKLRFLSRSLKQKEQEMLFAANAVASTKFGKSPERLIAHVGHRLSLCRTLAGQYLAGPESKVERQRWRGSTGGETALVYPEKLSELPAPLGDETQAESARVPKKLSELTNSLADGVLKEFEQEGIRSSEDVRGTDPGMLEQIATRCEDAVKTLSERTVNFAQRERAQERAAREDGWEDRVKHLEEVIKGVEADLRYIAAPKRSDFPNEASPEVNPAVSEELEGKELETDEPEDISEAPSDPAAMLSEGKRTTDILVSGWQQYLPSFPTPEYKSKRKSDRNKVRRLARPIFTTSNVEIRWDNVLDAEFAKSWPEEVSHLPMGYARHTAPHPGDAPVAGAAELRMRIQNRKNAPPKSEMRAYAETLQNQILEKMKAEVLGEQDQADLVAEDKNTKLIRGLGRHKKTVKRARAREKRAMAEEGKTLDASEEA